MINALLKGLSKMTTTSGSYVRRVPLMLRYTENLGERKPGSKKGVCRESISIQRS